MAIIVAQLSGLLPAGHGVGLRLGTAGMLATLARRIVGAMGRMGRCWPVGG